jgi:POT family proton-dependent oligopeptide transporter
MSHDSSSAGRIPAEALPLQRSSVFDHPIGFWFIFWGEFAERSSYYGMRAILLLYMVQRLGFSERHGSLTMHGFIAACYLLPLVGGFLADHYFGKYRTIVGFSIPYILGHVILGIESVPFLFMALCLLAMGTGVIKPNISTLMGMTYDQQRPGQTKLRSDGFALFYGSINIGAAISSFAMPWLRVHYSYRIAFLFPAALMVVAFLLFALGKPFYAVEKIQRERLTPEEESIARRQRREVLERILGLFLVVAFFWSIFDQSASTWTLFAADHLRLNFFGWKLAPDAIQGLNPIFILILLPPITLLWHLLPRLGIELRATDKMVIGFVLTGLTMALMSIAGFLAGDSGRVSIFWEVIPYLLITVAEICISVVGLELAFTAAPPSMKSFVTACWLLAVFVGDLLDMAVTLLYGLKLPRLGLSIAPGSYFALLALATIPVTVAFILIARKFHRTA